MACPEPARRINRVAIFTGSAPGSEPRYVEQAVRVASALAASGVAVVYGGGKVGLMGAVADAVLGAGGEVIGVMPELLVDAEIAHDGLTRLDVVADMHARKKRMAELADAFVALPGGVGTLEELFEVWTWQQLGLHVKPIMLYDSRFWSPMMDLLDHLVAQGFVRAQDRTALEVADDPDMLLSRLEAITPPPAKWGSAARNYPPRRFGAEETDR